MTFLGKEEIKEIRATDKTTPSGAEVREVVLLNELDILQRQIEDENSRIADLHAEQEGSTEERQKEITKSIEYGEEEVKRLEDSKTPEMGKERIILASYKTIENCETEEPDDGYFQKRKVSVVGEILGIMAEWNLQDIEIGQILQGVEESYKKNTVNSISRKFGKKFTDLNMLDHHYAITEDRKDN